MIHTLGFSDGHSGLDYYMWAVIPWSRAATNSDFTRVPGNCSLNEAFVYLALIRVTKEIIVIIIIIIIIIIIMMKHAGTAELRGRGPHVPRMLALL